MTTKAFAYLRVSGKGQIKGDGFLRQQTAIRKFAKSHSIELCHVYREKGVSGTLENRPALADLMIDLEQNGHGVKTIIIEKVDRLARDLMVQETIIADLQAKGFDLVSATEGDDLLSNDPTRKLVRQVLGAISEYEKKMIVLKLRAARERKRAKTGKCEGRKGYHEAAPEVLQEIKRLRRKQKGKKCLSFEKIASKLNNEGFISTTGKPFTGKNVSAIFHRKRK